MIYLSKQVVFKKESETLNTIIKDKQVLAKKKTIKLLVKEHNTIENQLNETRANYENDKENYQKKHQYLLEQQEKTKKKLLLLKIRKYRLEANEKPELRDHFGNQIKKYLKAWIKSKKYVFTQYLKGPRNYTLLKKCVLRAETKHLVRPILQSMKVCKHIFLWNQIREQQKAMLITKKMSNNLFLLQIYSTTGKYFNMTRQISETQYNQIEYYNPLQNLLIIPKRKILLFLEEYFQDTLKIKKIQSTLKILKFQIDVILQKKKIIYFIRMKINNFFESFYSVKGYENLQLQVLLMIKRKDMKKNDENYAQKMTSTLNNYRSIFDEDETKSYYSFYCGPLLPYEDNYRFIIQDQTILKSYGAIPQNFIQTFFKKYLIQLCPANTPKFPQKSKMANRNQSLVHFNLQNQSYLADQEQQNNLIHPKLVKIIDFSYHMNLKKVIKVSSAIKMRLQRKKYIQSLSLQKSNTTFAFKCKVANNFITSAFIKNDALIFIVECLQMSKTKGNLCNTLKYDKKYWKLAEKMMESNTFANIIKKQIVCEIQQQIQIQFMKIIEQYEKEQQIFNLMKPIKAVNRIRRVFIKTILKKKIKHNILFISKIQKQFASFVLIIRRSSFMKNVADVNLIVLKVKQKVLQNEKVVNKNMITSGNQRRLSTQFGLKTISSTIIDEFTQNVKYPKLSIFLENAQKLVKKKNNISSFLSKKQRQQQKILNSKEIQSQFYITQKYFMLKPLHLQYITNEYHFLQRFSSINLNSQQIVNQLENILLFRGSSQYSRQQQLRKTYHGDREHMNLPYPSSSSSINFQNNKIQASQQLPKDTPIFYSLYKDKSNMFFLQLYLIINNLQNGGCFKQVHKEQISKKQLGVSGWSMIFKAIAMWAHRNNYEEVQGYHTKNQLLGNSMNIRFNGNAPAMSRTKLGYSYNDEVDEIYEN